MAAQQRLTQADILRFDPLGNVTILHVTDIHAQLVPLYFREPSINLGVGEAKGKPPHLTDAAFRDYFNIAAGSPDAYALTADDFVALARNYGRMGGMDRIATLVKAIRAERGDDKVLLLDGGDTWQGSWTSLQTKGQDMVDVMTALKLDAMTAHWEFTLRRRPRQGDRRERAVRLPRAEHPRREWQEPVFEARKMFERGGVEDRRDRAGVAAHADRQSALDVPEMGVRHPRGGHAEAGRRSARRGRRRRRAAVAQRLRRRPQAGRPRQGHRRHPHRATPTTRCPAWSRSATRCWSRPARTASSCRASTST